MFISQFNPKFGKSFFIGFSLILSCFLLKMDANCMIYSRIQGEILNNDSGSPIANAEVILFQYRDNVMDRFVLGKTKTDKLGKFVFNNIIPGYYFIKTKKEGFISTLPDYKDDFIRGINLYKLEKMIAVVTIDKEGSIKHLRILLKQGRTIKGQITGITKKDVLGKPLIRVILSRKTDETEKIFNNEDETEIKNLDVNSDGSYAFSGLEARNDYKLMFEPEGFPRRYFNDIDVLTKETVTIDCVYDSNDKTGVKGNVKINGKVPRTFTISLDHNKRGDLIPYYYYDYQNVPSINPSGEFSIFMVAPGKYYIYLFAFDENHQGYEREDFIEIKKDETKVLDFNI